MPESNEVTLRQMPFDLLRRRRLFDWLFDGGPTDWFATASALPVDISRKNHDLIVRASVPGFEAKEIDLQVDNNTMTIRAEHTEEHSTKDEHFYRRERRRGYASRTVALPEEIAKGQATAVFKDGVLTVTAPVAQTSAHKVEIQTA